MADDVVDKIMHDFNKQGIPMTRGQILVQLSKEHHWVMTLSHLNASRRPAAGFIAAHALSALRRSATTDRQTQYHQSPCPPGAMIRPRIQSR